MAKKEFTATEVMALQERLEKRIEFIAENQLNVLQLKNRVDAIFEMVGKNTEDIEMIKITLGVHGKDIKAIKSELKAHTSELKAHTSEFETIKSELEAINAKLDRKVDKEELIKIDKRVTFLENKLKPA